MIGAEKLQQLSYLILRVGFHLSGQRIGKADLLVFGDAIFVIGHDCANVLFKAIEMCGDDVTSAAIRDNVENIKDLACVTGTISYTADNHVPDKSVVITKAENGALTFVTNI